MRRDSGRQARLVQVSAITLVVCLAIAALVLAWIAFELRHLSGDISQSRSRLPAAVRMVLPENTNVLSDRQVTLARYSKGVSQGAGVLFSTVPEQHLAGFVVLPPSTIVHGSQLSDLSNPDAIRALRRDGIPVSHVALIDPAKVPEIVSRVGGVSLRNRVPFAVLDADGHTVRFPAGKVHLDSRRAALYLSAVTTREPLEAASATLLSALVHRLLQPAGFQQLQAVGGAFADATSTDFRPADVLGLVDLRLRGGSVVLCRVPRGEELSAWQAATAAALGDSSTITGPCHRRQLKSAGLVPPQAVVRAAQHYGWQLFVAGAIVFGALAALVAVLLATRWPGRRAAAGGRDWTPRRPQYGDVVWSGGGQSPRPPVVDLTRHPPDRDESTDAEAPAPAPGDVRRPSP